MKKISLANVFFTMVATVISMTACSDDSNSTAPGTDPGEKNEMEDVILFKAEDGSISQLGNGEQEFEMPKGKYTLKKGTYHMKGWCYVADGVELTIEPGTIIKGDKETKAALIVERGGEQWRRETNRRRSENNVRWSG